MKTICIDFDDTIAPWGPLFDLDPPFAGVIAAMKRLRRAGYRIIILTSRLSPTWWGKDYLKFEHESPDGFGEANVSYVVDYLQFWNVPFDHITSEKVQADAYFDDRAVAVHPGELASSIEKWLRDATKVVPHG